MAYTTNRFSHMMRRIDENDNDTDPCYSCLSPPPPSSPPHHNLSFLLFVSVAVLGFFFLAAIYYTIFSKFCANRNRSPTPPQTQTPTDNTREEFLDENHPQVVDHPIWFIRTVGLDQVTINSISVFKYKKDDGLVDGNDCSVCLSEFQEDETLRLLPKCSHAFHLPCIDAWLRAHTNCPLCRAPIVSVANTVVDASGSGSGEETQNENLVESSGETEEERELQDGRTEVDVSSLPVKDYVLQVLDEMSETDEDGLQPVRRSVSLNSSILPLSNFVPLEGEVNSSAELVGEKNSSELASSSSSGRQFQKGAVPLKRSISSGAKFFTARNSRRWGSILPL